MGVWERQRAVQLYRGQIPSPGRPTVAWRPDRATARRDIENWIKAYNERRLHSSLGYETPTAA